MVRRVRHGELGRINLYDQSGAFEARTDTTDTSVSGPRYYLIVLDIGGL